MQVTVGNWYWRTDSQDGMEYWVRPDGATENIDLRTKEQRSQFGGTAGPGIFVFPEGMTLPAGYILLGDVTEPISSARRRDLESFLQLQQNTISGTRVVDAVFSVMSENADVTGLQRNRAKLPRRNGTFDITFGGVRYPMGVFDPDKHDWVLATLRHDYQRISPAGKTNRGLLQWMSDKYGFPKRQIAVPSGGVINESFNTSSGTTLGPDLTWTEHSGNWDVASSQAMRVEGGSGPTTATATSSLGSNDLYAQVSDEKVNLNGTRVGTAVRWAGSSGYTGAVRTEASSSQTYRLFKISDSTETQLGTTSTGGTEASANLNIRVEVLTDDLEVKYDASDPPTTSKLTVANDPTFSVGELCGIYARATATDRSICDSFEAGTLGGAPAAATVIRGFMTLGVGR